MDLNQFFAYCPFFQHKGVLALTHENSPVLFPVIKKVPCFESILKGSEKRKALSRLAREALQHSTSKSGHLLTRLEKRKNGAPVPEKGIHWSITHKSSYVAGVSAPFPVGIDIELKKEVRMGLKKRIASDEEWDLFPNRGAHHFFRIWTAKEAVLKAVGKGLTGLSQCRLIQVISKESLFITYADHPFTVEQFCFDNHIAALTTNERLCQWTHL